MPGHTHPFLILYLFIIKKKKKRKNERNYTEKADDPVF